MGKGKTAGPKKVRFDGLDVACMASELRRSLQGFKLANIYDAPDNKSTFLFKLVNPHATATATATSSTVTTTHTATQDSPLPETAATNTSHNGNKNRAMLVMESGIRFHPTLYHSGGGANAEMPSSFCMKLRKHLRNLRLENVVQLGHLDRVVDFRFGSGPTQCHHILLELYAQGNLILTTADYTILALLRVHEYDTPNKQDHDNAKNHQDEKVRVKVGNVYPVTYATTLTGTDHNNTSNDNNSTDSVGDKDETEQTATGILTMNGSEAYEWAQTQINPISSLLHPAPTTHKSNKKKNDAGVTIKMLLLKPTSGVYHYGPSLLEHCLLTAGLSPDQINIKLTPAATATATATTKDESESIMSVQRWDAIITALRDEGSRVLERFNTAERQGYVLYRSRSTVPSDDTPVHSVDLPAVPHADKIFEEFQPHLLLQHADRPSVAYQSFGEAVDEFFSLLEGQKRSLRAEAAEEAAHAKLAKIQRDQERRVDSLQKDQDMLARNAKLIEAHAEQVDNALGVINSALDTGMDWMALRQLVKVETEHGNPVASLIVKLDLEAESMVLRLDNVFALPSENNDNDNEPPKVEITVSLGLTAHANASEMFARYRAFKEKAVKTVEASAKALKAAEAAAQRQLAEAEKKKRVLAVVPQRKTHWFEKFNWFITSDNYLVLGGRDAQQNELLVKRYLRPGDAYLHADVHGAASCILRAKRTRVAKEDGGRTKVLPLSDQALREAGYFTICRSSAWTSRMVTSAWWVQSHQVSKTAPTGEYLTVGSFMVRGKKNFLPATPLEMGLGVLFRLGDEVSIARHANERRDFALMEEDESTSSIITDNGKDNAATIRDDDPSISDAPKSIKKALHSMSISSTSEEDSGDSNLEKEAESKQSTEAVAVDAVDLPKDIQDENPAEGNDENDDESVTTEEPKKKKGLSVRDRKLIKKYGSLEAAEKELKDLEPQTRKAPVKKQGEDVVNQEKLQVPKRGRKGRQKRAAKKYADQDDEDRELALMALHAGEKTKSAKKGSRNNIEVAAKSETQQKAAADTAALLVRDSAKVAERLPEEVRAIVAECITPISSSLPSDARWDKLDADVLEKLLELDSVEAQLAAANRLLSLTKSTRIDNFSASLSGILRTIQRYGFENLAPADEDDLSKQSNNNNNNKQRKTKAEKMAEKEAWKEVLAEDGILENDGDDMGGIDEGAEIGDTAELVKLTGKPVEDDALMYAIVVCAPYQTLAQYKYRVKLTPGNQKRGKASKQCVEMFLRGSNNDSSRDHNRNRELMKLVGDNEWVQAICGDVKISAPGASKLIKTQKKGGKKGGNKGGKQKNKS